MEEPPYYEQTPDSEQTPAEEASANPGFALGQLAAAFKTNQENPDAETRMRAATKTNKWLHVLQDMFSGGLKIGSRAPVVGTPTWATLEIVKGGFATGGLLAEGPLQPHEDALLTRIGANETDRRRAILNAYYLSDEGVAELQRMLITGQYRVNVPEEGALLAIAWLLAHEQTEKARNLLDKFAPYFDRLRFYPVPDPKPLFDGLLVCLQTVGDTIEDLKNIQPPERFLAQCESTLLWAPLSDRAVELFLETLEGPVPSLQIRPDGSNSVQGGWPCQQYPDGWREQALTLLNDYARLRRDNQFSGKPDRKSENFPQLRTYLTSCIDDPKRLTGRDVGRIRSILAHIVTRRGLPDSEQCRALRRYQASLANRPTNADFAEIVIRRLERLPSDEGLSNLVEVLAPVTPEEAATRLLSAGQPLTSRLEHKVRRCLAAPVESLVAQSMIPSSEILARVIPQMTAHVSASGLVDLELRRLYGAVYQAFRRRRSLLLLNLQSQVKLSELPWVQVMEENRIADAGARSVAEQTLTQVVTLAVTAFPHQILPNKLLQELRALVKDAGLDLPLVDEVAADIFMGTFSEKFLRAAQIAGRLLAGTLYERYYEISYESILKINDIQPGRWGGTPVSPAFAKLCTDRGNSEATGSYIARNGAIIEQEQILTTHNLAATFTVLGLTDNLRPRLDELARNNFMWICHHNQLQAVPWRTRLHMVKNMAYAWRQMIFFLSLEDDRTLSAFSAWAADYLSKQWPDFQRRFQPTFDGLVWTIQTMSAIESVERPDWARPFLGWTRSSHMLLEADNNDETT